MQLQDSKVVASKPRNCVSLCWYTLSDMQYIMPVFAINLVLLSLLCIRSAAHTKELKKAEYQGTFDWFLKKFLFLLSAADEKASRNIFKIFKKHLKSMDYDPYTSDLARTCKKLSRMDQEEIISELSEYREALENKSDILIAFLKAIDAAFTLQQRTQFDDYLYDLESYIRGDKLFIDHETKKLLYDVILKSIKNMSKRDQSDLKKKLKKVIKAYGDSSDEDSY